MHRRISLGWSPYPEDVAENNLKQMRLSLSLSQAQLGDKIGVHQTTISTLELGTTLPLTEKGQLRVYTEKLLNFFKCDLSDMFPRIACKAFGPGLVDCQHEGISRREDAGQGYDEVELKMHLAEALSVLSAREKDILTLLYCEGWTLEEVAGKIGRTKERVRQIEAQALLRLRRSDRAARIKEFWQ